MGSKLILSILLLTSFALGQVIPSRFRNTQITSSVNGVLNVKGPPFLAKGNGINDDTNPIQAAIESADGIVEFPPGTYFVSTLYYKSKITLRGSGIGATTLKLIDSSNCPIFSRRDAYYNDDYGVVNSLPAITDVTIENMTIDGNFSNQAPSNSDSWDFLVVFQRVVRPVIRGVHLRHGRTGGIILWQCKKGVVQSTEVDTCVHYESIRNEITAFRNFNAGRAEDSSGGGNLIENSIVMCDDIGNGISTEGTDFDQIVGNTVFNNTIGVESSSYVKIANNLVFYGKFGGIGMSDTMLRSPVGAIIAKNTIVSVSYHEGRISALGIAIHVTGYSEVSITNNTINGVRIDTLGPSWSTIGVNFCSRVSISNNKILNPDTSTSGTGLSGVVGIRMVGTTGAKISGNYIETRSHGILIKGSTEVSGNIVKLLGTPAAQAAVVVYDSSSVIGQNIFQSFLTGVLAGDSTATKNVIRENKSIRARLAH
jgi:hypothetical protein